MRAVIQEHRAVLGFANPAENVSELKKDKERYYRLVPRYFVFLDRELEVEFVDKKVPNESTNEASVIRAVIQEHRAVMGLANPTEKTKV
jgi:hypothetical protein